MKRLIESARVAFMYFLARLVKALARKGEYCPCCGGSRLVMEYCRRCDANLSDSELDKGYVVCRGCEWALPANPCGRCGEMLSVEDVEVTEECPYCIDDPF